MRSVRILFAVLLPALIGILLAFGLFSPVVRSRIAAMARPSP